MEVFNTARTCLIFNIERSVDLIELGPLSLKPLNELDIGGSPNIDSNLHRMDSSNDNDGPDMQFMGPSSYNYSQQSTHCLDELWPGQSVKFVVPRFEEVGIKSIVDVHPSRQWLRVNILTFSMEFILV